MFSRAAVMKYECNSLRRSDRYWVVGGGWWGVCGTINSLNLIIDISAQLTSTCCLLDITLNSKREQFISKCNKYWLFFCIKSWRCEPRRAVKSRPPLCCSSVFNPQPADETTHAGRDLSLNWQQLNSAVTVLPAVCEGCGAEVCQWTVRTRHVLPWWSWSPRSLSQSASCTHCFWFSSPALNQTGWRWRCTGGCATST